MAVKPRVNKIWLSNPVPQLSSKKLVLKFRAPVLRVSVCKLVPACGGGPHLVQELIRNAAENEVALQCAKDSFSRSSGLSVVLIWRLPRARHVKSRVKR